MQKIPNKEEQIVIDCLIKQGYSNIEFEPDGNVPPDIVIDGKIAVEVRRLNQNQKTNDAIKGLEQDEYAIQGLIEGIMNKVVGYKL